MTGDRCCLLRPGLAAALIVLAAAPAGAREFRLGPDLEPPPWLGRALETEEPPANDTPEVAWARESVRITEIKATQELEMIANRPDIAAAFTRYREAGGLVPHLRFAAGYADSEGFTTPSQPLTPQEEEKLRTGPLAFDLACTVLPESSGARMPRDEGSVSPELDRTLQVSVDVPAGVLRVGRAWIFGARPGGRGELVVRSQADLEHLSPGEFRLDRLANTMVDSMSRDSVTTAGPYGSQTRATCAPAPFSRFARP